MATNPLMSAIADLCTDGETWRTHEMRGVVVEDVAVEEETVVEIGEDVEELGSWSRCCWGGLELGVGEIGIEV